MANDEKGFRGASQNLPRLSSPWRCDPYSPKFVAGYDDTMAFSHLGARSHRAYKPSIQWLHMDLSSHRVLTKWVEATPLKKAIGATVVNFIREHIITRFGIPKRFISDNGTPFINKDMKGLIKAYHIKHGRSTLYPQGNG